MGQFSVAVCPPSGSILEYQNQLSEKVPIKGKKRVIITFIDEPFAETDLGMEIDPIRALRGCAKGSNLTEKLLESRRKDLNLEESKS